MRTLGRLTISIKSFYFCKVFFFFVGLILLLVNSTGLLLSLRNPDILTDPDCQFENDITINPWKARRALMRRPNEKRDVYLRRATLTVQAAIAHYWFKNEDKYNLRVPFTENFILNILGHIWKKNFLYYEFSDYNKALERGVGLCSQQVIILAGFLKENGIESRIVFIDGHIILIANNDSEWWILDPDYGVVIDKDYREALQDLNFIYSTYAKKTGPSIAESITKIYAKRVWIEFKDIEAYHSVQHTYIIEKISYILKWILPVACICSGLLLLKPRKT
jgi:hypothetical protein